MSREQVIAANVDVVLVVQALRAGPRPAAARARYLALALESGARPAVVLTKADLERRPGRGRRGDRGDRRRDSASTCCRREPGSVSDAIRDALGPGTTGVLLGPSGVGKSTLVNALIDDESRLTTGEVAPDGAGRHTTTRRELVLLPSGGVIVDNPGMREVHLWIGDGDLTDAFDDIAELALACRFSDCKHETEPGCAVRAALASGELAGALGALPGARARAGRAGRAARAARASLESGGGRQQRIRPREG